MKKWNVGVLFWLLILFVCFGRCSQRMKPLFFFEIYLAFSYSCFSKAEDFFGTWNDAAISSFYSGSLKSTGCKANVYFVFGLCRKLKVFKPHNSLFSLLASLILFHYLFSRWCRFLLLRRWWKWWVILSSLPTQWLQRSSVYWVPLKKNTPLSSLSFPVSGSKEQDESKAVEHSKRRHTRGPLLSTLKSIVTTMGTH